MRRKTWNMLWQRERFMGKKSKRRQRETAFCDDMEAGQHMHCYMELETAGCEETWSPTTVGKVLDNDDGENSLKFWPRIKLGMLETESIADTSVLLESLHEMKHLPYGTSFSSWSRSLTERRFLCQNLSPTLDWLPVTLPHAPSCAISLQCPVFTYALSPSLPPQKIPAL